MVLLENHQNSWKFKVSAISVTSFSAYNSTKLWVCSIQNVLLVTMMALAHSLHHPGPRNTSPQHQSSLGKPVFCSTSAAEAGAQGRKGGPGSQFLVIPDPNALGGRTYGGPGGSNRSREALLGPIKHFVLNKLKVWKSYTHSKWSQKCGNSWFWWILVIFKQKSLILVKIQYFPPFCDQFECV